jgi:hypothetical protein
MTTSKKIRTVVLTAVALTAVSLATVGNAFAGGGKHHHHGHHHHGHHAHHHHGHHHHHHHRYARWYGGGAYFSGVVASSCWRWIDTRRGPAKIYVCDDDSE